MSTITDLSVHTRIGIVFGKLLDSRLSSFFTKISIISPKQFGFRKKHHTSHALLTVLWYLRKTKCGVFFPDPTKAFDCVDHITVLSKLALHGFRGPQLDVMKSWYLIGRQQIVSITNALSSPALLPVVFRKTRFLGRSFLFMCQGYLWKLVEYHTVRWRYSPPISRHKFEWSHQWPNVDFPYSLCVDAAKSQFTGLHYFWFVPW